jgi:transposase
VGTDYTSIFLEVHMNAVGIDVSKGKSTVAIMRPFGEVIKVPFDVAHTDEDLGKLCALILSLDGETRVVMEYTGKYYEPVAFALHEAGIFVSVIHAKLIHNYGNDSIRRVKTDRKDSLKIAAYCLDKWLKLACYVPETDTRRTLKIYNRQYNQYNKLKVMLKNNLISLLDQTFPGVNELFTSPPRREDGHEKWVDFVSKFWHCDCISLLSLQEFKKRYATWCKKLGYRYSDAKAKNIYTASTKHFPTLPMNDATKFLIMCAIEQLDTLMETIAKLKHEMNSLASTLPEHAVVMSMHCVGETLGPQLIAEIGDIFRFRGRTSLACFAGIESPPHQSGKYEAQSQTRLTITPQNTVSSYCLYFAEPKH